MYREVQDETQAFRLRQVLSNFLSFQPLGKAFTLLFFPTHIILALASAQKIINHVGGPPAVYFVSVRNAFLVGVSLRALGS